MRRPARLTAFAGLFATILLTGVACTGRTLDLGYDDPAATTDNVDATDDVDAAFAGLVVDDEICTIASENVTSSSAEWPAYQLVVKATCGRYGRFLMYLESRADIGYPQACGALTRVSAGTETESDAEVLALTGAGALLTASADGTRGQCTIDAGPTQTTPNAALALNATVADVAGRSHRIRYARGAVGHGDQGAFEDPPAEAEPRPFLFVDNQTCAITLQGRDPIALPSYAVYVDATCPEIGRIRLYIQGQIDATYPQLCSATARVAVGLESESDAAAFVAYGPVATSCSLNAGPSEREPTARVSLGGTYGDGSYQAHRISYDSAGALAVLPEDAARRPPRKVVLSPGPGRPAPQACNAENGSTCRSDQECGGKPCWCEYGFCLPGSNCTTDADCAAGQRCALSVAPGVHIEPGDENAGYFCTTPNDDCTCDLGPTPPGNGYEPLVFCVYDQRAQHWGCVGGP